MPIGYLYAALKNNFKIGAWSPFVLYILGSYLQTYLLKKSHSATGRKNVGLVATATGNPIMVHFQPLL